MTKQIYLWCVLITFSAIPIAQKNVQTDDVKLLKGSQILKDAQKAIGTEKLDLSSFIIKTKIILGDKVLGTTDETVVSLPDKIRTSLIVEEPTSMTLIRIWNGEKYKALSEFDFQGNRMVRDVTNASKNIENSKNLESGIGKDKLEKFKKANEKDPKLIFFDKVWADFFPLTLIHPFEKNIEFKYVGKAEASNRTADVIDFKSKDGKDYRLLFDSETNYLLLMIESFKGEDGNYETKYYYSNRELVDKVLIPKKIKVEHKFTPIGKATRVSYRSLEVVDFELNPEFKKDLFEIK